MAFIRVTHMMKATSLTKLFPEIHMFSDVPRTDFYTYIPKIL